MIVVLQIFLVLQIFTLAFTLEQKKRVVVIEAVNPGTQNVKKSEPQEITSVRRGKASLEHNKQPNPIAQPPVEVKKAETENTSAKEDDFLTKIEVHGEAFYILLISLLITLLAKGTA